MSARGEGLALGTTVRRAGRQAPGKLRLTLVQAIVLSLALHVALGLPVFYLTDIQPVADVPETLVVDLDGLVSDRQQDEKKADDPAPAPLPQPAPPPPPPPQQQQQQQQAAPPPPPPQPVEAADVPAEAPPPPQQVQQAAKPVETPPPPPPPMTAVPVTDPSPADEAQGARTIAKPEDDEDAMRRYGVVLVKRVQARLIYPPAERASGAEGAVKVSFAIHADGSIDPASLRIVAGSGTQAFDAAALATIAESAPYPPPPQPTTVAFSLFFGKKK